MLCRIHTSVTVSTAPHTTATYCTEYVKFATPALCWLTTIAHIRTIRSQKTTPTALWLSWRISTT